MKTITSWALLAAIASAFVGGTALAEEPVAVEVEDDHRHRINFGLGVDSKIGVKFQVTYEDRERDILVDNFTLPISVIARPTATGVAAFARWFVEEARPWRLDIEVDESTAQANEGEPAVGGQTLPSAYYLRDDVQYFPTGPEFKLTNQVQSIEEFQREVGADDADPWWRKHVMSEKAREIERNLGIAGPDNASVEPEFVRVWRSYGGSLSLAIVNPTVAGSVAAYHTSPWFTVQFGNRGACAKFESVRDALE